MLIALILLAVTYVKRDILINAARGNVNTVSRVSQSIPKEAEEYEGHYYAICPEADSWKEAKDLCEKKGGHLVSITSAEEDNFVRSMLVCHQLFHGL